VPNIWSSDGTPAVEPELYSVPDEYVQQLRWEPELKGHGYRGIVVTAADDFAEPYIEIDDEDWDLI